MNIISTCGRQPWNKGKLVGQKAPLRLRDIWAIRVRLQIGGRTRDLALFDLAIDNKLDTGGLDPRTIFLFKPWTLEQLIEAVGQALIR